MKVDTPGYSHHIIIGSLEENQHVEHIIISLVWKAEANLFGLAGGVSHHYRTGLGLRSHLERNDLAYTHLSALRSHGADYGVWRHAADQ